METERNWKKYWLDTGAKRIVEHAAKIQLKSGSTDATDMEHVLDTAYLIRQETQVLINMLEGGDTNG